MDPLKAQRIEAATKGLLEAKLAEILRLLRCLECLTRGQTPPTKPSARKGKPLPHVDTELVELARAKLVEMITTVTHSTDSLAASRASRDVEILFEFIARTRALEVNGSSAAEEHES